MAGKRSASAHAFLFGGEYEHKDDRGLTRHVQLFGFEGTVCRQGGGLRWHKETWSGAGDSGLFHSGSTERCDVRATLRSMGLQGSTTSMHDTFVGVDLEGFHCRGVANQKQVDGSVNVGVPLAELRLRASRKESSLQQTRCRQNLFSAEAHSSKVESTVTSVGCSVDVGPAISFLGQQMLGRLENVPGIELGTMLSKLGSTISFPGVQVAHGIPGLSLPGLVGTPGLFKPVSLIDLSVTQSVTTRTSHSAVYGFWQTCERHEYEKIENYQTCVNILWWEISCVSRNTNLGKWTRHGCISTGRAESLLITLICAVLPHGIRSLRADRNWGSSVSRVALLDAVGALVSSIAQMLIAYVVGSSFVAAVGILLVSLCRRAIQDDDFQNRQDDRVWNVLLERYGLAALLGTLFTIVTYVIPAAPFCAAEVMNSGPQRSPEGRVASTIFFFICGYVPYIGLVLCVALRSALE